MSPIATAECFRLDGQVAIVTGASSGLGERFARVLHGAGATVVLSARRADRLAETAASLDGDAVAVVPCDVGDDDSCRAMVNEVIDRYGRVDVLVNNAGVNAAKPILTEPIDEFRHVVNINLVAPFLISQLVGSHMVAAGTGSIVNIASIYGLVGSAPIPQSSYCASKAGLVNLTRECALQWARSGVRVNAIAPGWFPSEMTAEKVFADEAAHGYVRRNCPMGRGGHTDELDGALLFLASAASTFVTGQVLAVDGGWTAR